MIGSDNSLAQNRRCQNRWWGNNYIMTKILMNIWEVVFTECLKVYTTVWFWWMHRIQIYGIKTHQFQNWVWQNNSYLLIIPNVLLLNICDFLIIVTSQWHNAMSRDNKNHTLIDIVITCYFWTFSILIYIVHLCAYNRPHWKEMCRVSPYTHAQDSQ